MKAALRCLAAALLLVAGPILAGPALAQPVATIADAAFLEGQWAGEGIGGLPAGESWSATPGGTMVGHFWQQAADGSVMFAELMTLAPDGSGSLTMRLKHFGADLAGWEAQEGAAAEEFPLLATGPGLLQFAGLEYRLQGDGSLLVSVVTGADGTTQALAFTFRRAGR